MSTKFSMMFTPGRGFKKPSPIHKDNRNNPFRKNKSPSSRRNSNDKPQQKSTNKGVCNNCGIQGHPVWKCDKPLSSYGIIVVRDKCTGDVRDKSHELVMITRKDSYEYMTLIKNVDVNVESFTSIAKGITLLEKQKILTHTFQEMWTELYGHTHYKNSKKLFNISKERFEKYKIRSIVYSIKDTELKETPEWSIPKGKPHNMESWKDCALRELHEETNISSSQISILDIPPLYHLKTGSDGKTYLGVYYIAMCNNSDNNSDITFKPQLSEIQNIEWKPIKYLKEIQGFPYKELKIIIERN